MIVFYSELDFSFFYAAYDIMVPICFFNNAALSKASSTTDFYILASSSGMSKVESSNLLSASIFALSVDARSKSLS